jgi:C4-dicarboxylate-binding protein DctP
MLKKIFFYDPYHRQRMELDLFSFIMKTVGIQRREKFRTEKEGKMKKMGKVFIVVLGLSILGPSIFGDSLIQAQTTKPSTPVVMKVAHGFGPTNAVGIAGQNLKKAVDAKLAGRVKMEYYPAEQLFKTVECHRELKSGGIQATIVWTSYLQSFDPLWGVAEYPFAFNNAEHFVATMQQSEEGKKLITRTAEGGITLLGDAKATKHGMMKYVFSNKPIKSMADFKGLKLRNPPGWMIAKVVDNFGASNVTISIAEFGTALQQGMVDGTMTNANGWEIWGKLFQVKAKNILKFPLGSAYHYSAVNTTWWNSLPLDIKKDLQPLLIGFGEEVAKLYWDQYVKMWKEIKDLEKQGKFTIVIPSDNFTKPLVECQSPLHSEFIKKIPNGREVLEIAKRLAPNYPVHE